MKEKAYKLLMLLQGLFWAYMVIRSALEDKAAAIVLVMLAIDGACYVLLAFAGLRRLFFRLAALLFLGANTVLTVADQMGFYDYLVLGWNLVLLALVVLVMFKQRRA